MNAEAVWYLDSSAIVKMVAEEAETEPLLGFLRTRQTLVSSALAMTEVTRAVIELGDRFIRQASEVLDRIGLVRVSDEILKNAGLLGPASLRSLDVIHLATAALFGDTLSGLVTYDRRMFEAAELFGWSAYRPA